MKKEKSLMILVVALVVLMAGAFFLYNKLTADNGADTLMGTSSQEQSEPAEGSASDGSEETSTESGEEEPVLAPDFTVVDGDGNEVSLSDFKGRPVVLNFWATWCGYCVQEMPAFQQAYDEYSEEVAFLMVNATDGYQETLGSAQKFMESSGYTFPAYYDVEQEAAYAYYINSLPTTLFINADGELTAHARTALDLETLKTGIAMILPEE